MHQLLPMCPVHVISLDSGLDSGFPLKEQQIRHRDTSPLLCSALLHRRALFISKFSV